jgi:hypothetical protein
VLLNLSTAWVGVSTLSRKASLMAYPIKSARHAPLCTDGDHAMQVTIEEIEPSSTEEQRDLPSFGSGIEFRPQHRIRGDIRQPAEPQEPGRHSEHAAAGVAAPGLSFLQDDPMDSEDAGGTANVQLGGGGGGSEDSAMPKAPRQRNYRNRR